MKFMLVNGTIQFPKYVTKDGRCLPEKPSSQILCNKLGVTEAPIPAQQLVEAVQGKYFERYEDAKTYLKSIDEMTEE